MKTQTLIAAALTAALIAAAVALFTWRSQADLPLAKSDQDSPPELAAPASGAVSESDARSIEQNFAKADPPVPPGILRTCTNGFRIERDKHGAFQGWHCNRSAYESYSTEALESLAYGDAEAAKILAHRLRHTDYPRALRLAQRSSALDGGDTSILMSAANWRPLLDSNGEPDLSGYGQAYVIHTLIQKLRHSGYSAPPTYEKRIREMAEDPDEVLMQLNSIADRMYLEMQQIEQEITGNSTIGGQDDA